MLGAIGQFETEIRAERQMDGIRKAKDRGVRFGKQPALNSEQITELRERRAQGTLIRDLIVRYGLSKATIYRYLAENEA
ncbi:helix-turn-helix domain-containing protein [uncultured Tateyamaria sp.]|uniref:helix-turn-helix domain-containing protein n=1 Tax=uncultured Tateyamaria sp. TaxID=455651 RepID=UPI00260F983A|nr:helix-turn-helix domain-containing protein [uncultured Tateyamaria sp.]